MAFGSKPSSSAHDLLVVGPGVLGSYLGKLWKEAHPECTVIGLTNTTTNHARLQDMGLDPATKDTLPDRKFPYVAFTAPPSGSVDYAAEVAAAAARWDGTGSLVFSSSMSVCAVDDGGPVSDTHLPLVPLGAGPTTDKLLAAEAEVTKAGGNIVRLVGLYHSQRGAHTYFLRTGQVSSRWGGYTINLLHYEDAAGICARVLECGSAFRGSAFIGCDNHPATLEAMMEACAKSGLFPDAPPVAFTAPVPAPGASGHGKRVDNSGTREALGGWAPKYDSFLAFMAGGARDFYNGYGVGSGTAMGVPHQL